jgi:protein-S-isoprenylcysteine O-methyltransferase Ste14
MPVVALAAWGAWVAVTVGLRVWHQRRCTGDSGFRLGDVKRGSAEWWAAVLFFVAVPANPAAALAGLAGLEPLRVPGGTVVHIAGVVIALVGLALTSAAQMQMGDAWRVGVDQATRVRLVVGGPFRLVRNPIYSAMAINGIGVVLILPNLIALAQLGAFVVGLQIQVRRVEEPYLRRVNGIAYAQYSTSVGRFIPGIGRQPLAERDGRIRSQPKIGGSKST